MSQQVVLYQPQQKFFNGTTSHGIKKSEAEAEATKKSESQILARLENVRNILLILSGKGGVGKSTISAQLAWSLCYYGYDVGILDIENKALTQAPKE